MIVSFDLDSTLADTAHRAGLIHSQRDLTDWEAYSMACASDGPGPALPLVHAFQGLGATVVIVSARNEGARAITHDWLKRHAVHAEHVVLYDEEIFGSALRRNKITHVELKVRQLAWVNGWYQHLRGERISLHVDDWPEVRDAVQSKLHIPTVIVTPLPVPEVSHATE